MQKSRIPQAVEAARLLHQLELKKFSPIPDDYFTFESYVEDNKCGTTKAHKDIKNLVKAGVLEVSSWPTLTQGGRTLNKQIYKIKK